MNHFFFSFRFRTYFTFLGLFFFFSACSPQGLFEKVKDQVYIVVSESEIKSASPARILLTSVQGEEKLYLAAKSLFERDWYAPETDIKRWKRIDKNPSGQSLIRDIFIYNGKVYALFTNEIGQGDVYRAEHDGNFNWQALENIPSSEQPVHLIPIQNASSEKLFLVTSERNKGKYLYYFDSVNENFQKIENWVPGDYPVVLKSAFEINGRYYIAGNNGGKVIGIQSYTSAQVRTIVHNGTDAVSNKNVLANVTGISYFPNFMGSGEMGIVILSDNGNIFYAQNEAQFINPKAWEMIVEKAVTTYDNKKRVNFESAENFQGEIVIGTRTNGLLALKKDATRYFLSTTFTSLKNSAYASSNISKRHVFFTTPIQDVLFLSVLGVPENLDRKDIGLAYFSSEKLIFE